MLSGFSERQALSGIYGEIGLENTGITFILDKGIENVQWIWFAAKDFLNRP
jgi:hypothetical protein